MSSYIIKNYGDLSEQLAQLDAQLASAKSAAKDQFDAQLNQQRADLQAAEAANAELGRVDAAADFDRRLVAAERKVQKALESNSLPGLQVDKSQPAVVKTLAVAAARELVTELVSSAENSAENLVSALTSHRVRMLQEAARKYQRLQLAKLALSLVIAAGSVFAFRPDESLWWGGLMLAAIGPAIVEYFIAHQKARLRPGKAVLSSATSFCYCATAAAGAALTGEVLIQGLYLDASATVSDFHVLMAQTTGSYLVLLAAASVVIASVRASIKRAGHAS